MKVIEQELVYMAFMRFPFMEAFDMCISISKREIAESIDKKIWLHNRECDFASGFIRSEDVGVRYLDYKDLSK